MGGNMLKWIARHRVSIVLLGVLAALVMTARVALPAGAVTGSEAPPLKSQENNQNYHGASNFHDSASVVGHHQGNTGNPGVNHGFNQDNSVNSGNQVSTQRKIIGVQSNNQFLHRKNGTGAGNTATFIGAFQGNSGNSGFNLGNNQDNSVNSGNQVNNQGNVIGTQINKQGSSVTNDGNIIQHQINYIDLIPGLGVYVSLRPKIQFAVSVGN